MSGQGWQDPYDPYGQPGGQYGAGPPPPGYGAYPGYGPGYGPPMQQASQGAAIAALVCNIIALVSCCGLFSIGGIITSAMAMNRTQTDPGSARSLTVWSWVLLGLNFIVLIALIIIFAAAGVFSESSNPDYSGSY